MNFEQMLNNITLGDSYKLIKNIPNNSIDCIYTDIPYLYNQGGGGKSELGQRMAKKSLELMGAKKVYEENKDITRDEALRIAKNKEKQHIDFISLENGIDYSILDEFCRVMKLINIFIWCSKLQINDIMNYFISKGCFFEILVWCKTNPSPITNNTWLPDIEYCLYFREKGVNYNDGYDLKHKWYLSPANKKDKDKYGHPTIKPLELVKKHLLHTTQPNDIILDPFSGSGTTCVACKEIDRQYIGIEISPDYYKASIDRLDGVLMNGQIELL